MYFPHLCSRALGETVGNVGNSGETQPWYLLGWSELVWCYCGKPNVTNHPQHHQVYGMGHPQMVAFFLGLLQESNQVVYIMGP